MYTLMYVIWPFTSCEMTCVASVYTLMYIALDQVRTDGGFCPVALFWLEMFCEHLERTPVSARALFIDMSSILLSSGYISVQRQRNIARELARTRIKGFNGHGPD